MKPYLETPGQTWVAPSTPQLGYNIVKAGLDGAEFLSNYGFSHNDTGKLSNGKIISVVHWLKTIEQIFSKEEINSLLKVKSALLDNQSPSEIILSQSNKTAKLWKII